MVNNRPPVDLHKVLTPALFSGIIAYQFPWDVPVDIKVATDFFWGIPDNSRRVYDTIFHQALLPISQLVPNVPNLTHYLPPMNKEHEKEYLEHTLALILLVDQGPRSLFRGINNRYTVGFFDVMAQNLVKDLISAGKLPDSIDRWMKVLGFPFEDAMMRKYWFYAPLIHSEDLRDHEIGDAKVEEMRKEIEEYSGTRDPARDTREEDSRDTLLFARLVGAGPPSNPSFAEFMFWIFRIFDAHTPVIKEYGRYPASNRVTGRETTSKEEKFLRINEELGMPKSSLTDEEAAKIKRQVKDGVWDKLVDKGPPSSD